MDHGLLIAAKIVAEPWVLLECLPDSADIAVAENSEASLDEPMLLPVAAGILCLKKSHNGLGDRQAASHEEILPGSTGADWGQAWRKKGQRIQPEIRETAKRLSDAWSISLGLVRSTISASK